MTGQAAHDGSAVVAFRSPMRLIGDQRRRVKAMFPGWSARYGGRRDAWYAYRVGEPRFGAAACGRSYMLQAGDIQSLIAALEQQVCLDIRIEFPGWRVRCARTDGWYAYPPRSTDNRLGDVPRLVHAPVLSGLLFSLRILTRRGVLAPRRP
jgi:hypothetical protein